MEAVFIMKREEANDVVQYLLPNLKEVGIDRNNLKVDTTLENLDNKRGDVWISQRKHNNNKFENEIIALIEAKHRKCNLGDVDWRDAMEQGKEKARKQGLSYYIVTNCKDTTRFYSAFDDSEIKLDGHVIINFVPLEVLVKIQSQITAENIEVIHKTKRNVKAFTESTFRKSLKKLEDIYRTAGLRGGDQRIDPTVSIVVLKYISEKEAEERTLNPVIQLWDDFDEIVSGKVTRDLSVEFNSTVNQIWGEISEYKNNQYQDFRNLVRLPESLKHEHYLEIYKELNNYHFHGGAKFDLFGTIYEEFATQSKKKDFGEFYTRRHITNTVAKLLFRNEKNYRNLKVCDPACGTGGFLTEAYKVLSDNYIVNNQLNDDTLFSLQNNTFWGFDNDAQSVARTKLNMFLVGDGHNHIYENDSLINWNSAVNWEENEFDFILANPPMGTYSGGADIDYFDFTSEKRFQLLFLERIIRATKQGGEMAVVIDDGVLETPTRASFRKKLLENCTIKAIVSLNKFVFAPYTKEKTYVLFMQKKQKSDIGTVQNTPIWNYILDYDGYANSDNRFKTKYHDDLPELEDMFVKAMNLLDYYSRDREYFESRKSLVEREVNDVEKQDGLIGMKCQFVNMNEINEETFHNLLSEFHLRSYEFKKATLEEVEDKFNKLLMDLEGVLKDFKSN